MHMCQLIYFLNPIGVGAQCAITFFRSLFFHNKGGFEVNQATLKAPHYLGFKNLEI